MQTTQRDREPRRELIERPPVAVKATRDKERRETIDVFADDFENPQICRSID